MRRFLKNRRVLKTCKIYEMLSSHAKKKHLSFHTPGHKVGAWDITELSFSDNLSAPSGCILDAERDIAKILGANRSFILTDGSTSGVLSMLYAVKTLGAKTVAFPSDSHKSVYGGCKALGLNALVFPSKTKEKIPFPYTMDELKADFSAYLEQADAVFITSPNYYGRVAELSALREYADETGKLLLVDGAHGGHLHFDKKVYAGAFADLWVDGVHKCLPALTQGAVVSARDERTATALKTGVDIFRTTSPSYPIMASVEYAVKCPENRALALEVGAWKQATARVVDNDDVYKIVALFGKKAFAVEKELEGMGIYPEFCDGNAILFYLSPATKKKEFLKLKKTLTALFEKYPYEGEKELERVPAPVVLPKNRGTEWVEVSKAEGRICALECGLFPPCTPLFRAGGRIDKEALGVFLQANHRFGTVDDKILVFKKEEKE